MPQAHGLILNLIDQQFAIGAKVNTLIDFVAWLVMATLAASGFGLVFVMFNSNTLGGFAELTFNLIGLMLCWGSYKLFRVYCVQR